MNINECPNVLNSPFFLTNMEYECLMPLERSVSFRNVREFPTAAVRGIKKMKGGKITFELSGYEVSEHQSQQGWVFFFQWVQLS